MSDDMKPRRLRPDPFNPSALIAAPAAPAPGPEPFGMVLTSAGDLHKSFSKAEHAYLIDHHGSEVTWSATMDPAVGKIVEHYPNR